MGEPGETERGRTNMAASGRTTARRTAGYRTGYTNQNRQMYVYGNAVRKEQVLPQRMPETETAKERKTSRQVRKNRNRALSINPAYAGFLAVAAVVAVLVCVCYLKLQSDIVSRSENITALQEELAAMTEANDTAMHAAEDAVDLEEVRTKAVSELGMVYAAQGNVVEYDAPSNESVTQYNDIPSGGILAKSGEAGN